VTDALSDVKLHVVTCIDDLLELKRWAGERRETPMGVDTESGGLRPWADRLRLIQLGDMHHGWAIPWEGWGGAALELLNAYQGEFVMHNSSYDARVLGHHTGWKAPWHRVHDTLTLAALADPGRPKKLKVLANRLVSPTASAGEKLLHDGMDKQGWTWDTVPLDFAPYFIYSALDPVLTCHIWNALHPTVSAAHGEVYDLERATLRIVSAMMTKGMRVDRPYVHRERAKLLDFSTQARAWLMTVHDVSSPLSPGQVSRAFLALGEEIHAYTKGGAPQMDKEALEGYEASGLTPDARQLATYINATRHADKMVSTYLDNFLEMADANDILHCSINPMAARTSRMSISDPSMQNLSRDDKQIRGSFIPAQEGNVFLTCDADQIEGRMGAHISQDENLIADFIAADQPGAPDFFSVVARNLYRDESITKKDKRRDRTKTYFYAKQYGSGLDRLARTSGVPFEQVQETDRLFMQRYHRLAAHMGEVTAAAREQKRAGLRPFVKTMMGRVLPGDPGKEYALLNYEVQGSAAEVLKRGMIDLDAVGLLDYMILPIHDEVLFEVPKDQAEDILRLVERTLTNRTDYRVPITWSGDILPTRWQKV
jgi:DNA polymerase I